MVLKTYSCKDLQAIPKIYFFRPLCSREILLFSIWGQTKVYELITEIELTNQNARNASEVENLIMLISQPPTEIQRAPFTVFFFFLLALI